MSDGSLSQDEIDALLQGGSGMDFGGGAAGGGAGGSEQQVEAFRNIVAGTLESQRSNFSMLLGKQVSMQAPTAELVDADGLVSRLGAQVVEIRQDLTEGIQVSHFYLMAPDSAVKIAEPLMGQEGVEMNDAAINALQEAIQQVSGPVITALGDAIGETVMTDPPAGRMTDRGELSFPGDSFVKLTYHLSVEGGPPAELVEVYDASVLSAVAAPAPQQAPAAGGGGMSQNAPSADPFAGLAGGGGGGGFGMGSPGQSGSGPTVQSVQFGDLQGQPVHQESGNIGLLMDVYMEMTVELGRTKKLIKEILGMGEGTIIELDKLAGEPVDILVNHKLIAKGEVVVIDENFGVRVTEIVSPMERVGNMT
jgi:flagellar motor switch protein FliN